MTKLKPHDICFVLLSFNTFFYFATLTNIIYENIYLESTIDHRSIKIDVFGTKVVSFINLKSSTKYGINLKSESENSKRHQMKVKAKRKKKSALEASRRFSIRWAAPDRILNLLDASRRCPPSTLKAPLLI